MANLLNRFYDVDNGDIMIDGNSIKKISKKSLNDLIGLVTQDSILFNESISTEEFPSISPFNIFAISIALNFIACKIREFQEIHC